MLTMFTWGYWGWGSTTRELVEAVDAAERARGFKPPMFVDVRLRRSVRAPGFSGGAFKKTIGASRYEWIPKLGNRSVETGEPRIRIDDPSAAAGLLKLAIENSKHRRRVLLFCSCEDINVSKCHRHVVAKLLLKEARKSERHLEIVEWPGGIPEQRSVVVSSGILKAVLHGRKSVPLGKTALADRLVTLPWGSIVNLIADGQTLPVVTGPAKYQGGAWCLPVRKAGVLNGNAARLKHWAERNRRELGLTKCPPCLVEEGHPARELESIEHQAFARHGAAESQLRFARGKGNATLRGNSCLGLGT